MRLRFLLHDAFTKGGGVLTVTFALARDLADKHDVELVSLLGAGTPHPQLPRHLPITTLAEGRRGEGLNPLLRRASRLPSRAMPVGDPRFGQYSLYTDWLLRRYLRSQRGGVVITMQPAMNIALARFGTDRYVKVAQDHRPFVTRHRSVREGYRRYGDRLDAMLTLTSEDADHYRGMLAAARVQPMPNGAPPYDGPVSDQTNKVAVAAGRLEPSKGFHLLIDAWRRVADRHPDWELRIFGEGRERPQLEAQLQRHGLTGRVRLMGYSERLQHEMARASFFVLSSRAEGYPMVLLEAMSCGLPLVSTDCPAGGPRDIITPGVDGFLVPNRDKDSLAAAMIELIELGDSARRRMGEAARQRARQQSQSHVAARWDALVQELARR